MTKKYQIVPFNFEYNDSTYEEHGYALPHTTLYDSIKEAKKASYELLFQEYAGIYPSMIDGMDCREDRYGENDVLGQRIDSATTFEQKKTFIEDYNLEIYLPRILELDI